MKSFLFLFLDDFNHTVKLLFTPINKRFTFITTIRPNFSHCVHDGKQRTEYFLSGMTLINISRMNHHNNRITRCINYNMSFPTLNLFPPIEPRFFDRFWGSLNRLTIDDSGTWIFITT